MKNPIILYALFYCNILQTYLLGKIALISQTTALGKGSFKQLLSLLLINDA